ncbi:hypothetical protein G9P44_004352 [Scheffersomyces stipitis]|nr:hypothetical protein G9P44_004352 [Scheffersomyces stipitis]
MATEAGVPVALSTYQDESTFQFERVKGSEIVRPHLSLGKNPSRDELESKITEYYCLDELVEVLKKSKEDNISREYNRITLQFPDSLICDSATIVHELQRRLGVINDAVSRQKLWILADTSYSPCCIDEVAAEHVNSDLVVHFGDACLNPIDKLPAVYVFGKPVVDVANLVNQFKTRYPIEECQSSKILLMSDSPHTYILKQVYEQLAVEYSGLCYADLALDPSTKATIIGYKPHSVVDAKFKTMNRALVGLENVEDYENDEFDIDTILSEHELFHISTPEAPRLLQLVTKFSSVTLYDAFTKQISQGPYPNLMRRYRYMHMARSAGTVGLLVNTLSLANTKKLINTMAKRIKDAGKKHYIFVVGKPNVAKLANFENVDMWCVLGCDHQGIIVDQSNEYFKPIVTPYELLLALSDELTWTGKWITDFKQVLKQVDEEEDADEEEKHDEDDDEDAPPEFDAVTGRYVSTSRPLRQLQHLQISSQEEVKNDVESKALVNKLSSAVAIKNTVSTSAQYLQTRHWTGLGSDYNTEEGEISSAGANLEEGRGGIARGYDYDREVHS